MKILLDKKEFLPEERFESLKEVYFKVSVELITREREILKIVLNGEEVDAFSGLQRGDLRFKDINKEVSDIEITSISMKDYILPALDIAETACEKYLEIIGRSEGAYLMFFNNICDLTMSFTARVQRQLIKNTKLLETYPEIIEIYEELLDCIEKRDEYFENPSKESRKVLDDVIVNKLRKPSERFLKNISEYREFLNREEMEKTNLN